MGGIPILWKEDGTGEKWAVIELGRLSPGRITAILGAAQPIPTERNRWRYPWVEAQIDGNPGSPDYLRYVPVENGLTSQAPMARVRVQDQNREIADPADEDRKFNLYIGGAE